MEQDVAGRQIGSHHAVQHRRQGCGTDGRCRLPQGGQRNGKQRRVLQIVDADQADLTRDRMSEPEQCVHQARSGPVVGANDAVWWVRSQQRGDSRGISGIEAVHQAAVNLTVRNVQRLAIAGLARIDRRGRVPEAHEYDATSGEVRSIVRVPAGYGKVAVVEELEATLGTTPDRTIYVGDGSSDVHLMLHVNNRDGFTIAVSENRQLARIAKTTVLSDNAFSIMVPVFEQILGRHAADIRALFEENGLTLHEWEKARTDRVTVRESSGSSTEAVA